MFINTGGDLALVYRKFTVVHLTHSINHSVALYTKMLVIEQNCRPKCIFHSYCLKAVVDKAINKLNVYSLWYRYQTVLKYVGRDVILVWSAILGVQECLQTSRMKSSLSYSSIPMFSRIYLFPIKKCLHHENFAFKHSFPHKTQQNLFKFFFLVN